MNRDVGRAWVAALRSGEYEQGRNYLRTRDLRTDRTYHCCLGVLCELARVEGVVVLDEDPGAVTVIGRYRPAGQGVDLGEVATLPTVVAEWAGLESESPFVAGRELTVWNDGGTEDDDGTPVRPHTFLEIADLLEAKLHDVLTGDGETRETNDD